MAVPVCSPSAAAPRPRPRPVRAEFHAPPRVKAAQRSGAPVGLGLDTRVVYWVSPHGRQRFSKWSRSGYVLNVKRAEFDPEL